MAYQYDGAPLGPYYGPNRMLIVQQDDDGTTYQLNIFPDVFNEELRREGKPLQFYYLPDSPRMARYENGDYMFHFSKFAGVLTADDNIAVASPGQIETAGGVLAFTSTLKIPDNVIQAAIDKLKDECANNVQFSSDRRFKIERNTPGVNLGVVPIVENTVTISNITPENLTDPNSQRPDDPWLWKMQGEGKGTINPVGNNAFTAMVGQFPAQIIEQSFKGVSSPIFVHNALKHKFYTGAFTASVEGDWKDVFDSFSADLHGQYLFFKADIQTAYTNAVKKGVIKQKITIDTEVISDPAEQQKYQAQVNAVFDKFLAQGEKVLFDPQPAKPSGSGPADTVQKMHDIQPMGAAGVGFSMKYEHYETHLSLYFQEEIDETYIKDNVISAHMMGFYEPLRADRRALAKYFDVVHLAEGFRKVHVIASARAYWPDENGNGGDPIEQLVLQVGYPDSTGAIVYKNSGLYMDNAAAQKSTTLAPAVWTRDNKTRIIIFDFERQNDLPPDQQNVIYVRRQVRFQERPCVEIPGRTVTFEEEKITEHSIEVKAEALGELNVGPVELATRLDDRTRAEVTFRRGNRVETMRFPPENKQPQFFQAYTSDAADALHWSYQVRMFIESKVPGLPAISYQGEEIPMLGSAPLIAQVPMPPDDLKEQIRRLKELGEELGGDF